MKTPSKTPSSKVTSSDELVLQLFDKVRAKQREIAASEKPIWKTSCTIGTDPNNVNTRINIQTVSDIDRLIDLYGFLLQKADYTMKSAEMLSLPYPSFKWMSYGLAEWRADIQTRIAQIQLTAKRAELKTLEERLDRLISPEQRRELELVAIAKELEG